MRCAVNAAVRTARSWLPASTTGGSPVLNHQTAAAFAALTMLARTVSAQPSSAPVVRYDQFFPTLFAAVAQDVRANGGPSLTARDFGSANALAGLLVAQIVSLPTGSNAGGFAWTYDPGLGTWSRSVNSFGPQTAERAQTVGRRKANLGFTYQRFTFDRLDGHDISVESQGLLPGLAVQDLLALSRADVALSTTFVNYGVTSRLDVGLFLPVVSVAIDGSLDYTVRRGGASGPVLAARSVTASARETRLGDPVFRGKYNFIRRFTWGLAVAFDGRVPTDNQLGAGSAKLQLIGSGAAGGINLHLNVGSVVSDCNNEAVTSCDQVGGPVVVGGIDKAVTDRLTVAADVQVQRVDVEQLARTVPTTTAAQRSGGAPTLAARANTVTVSVTGKYNLWGNLLLTASGLIPANSSGLIDRFTPIIGLDYAW